MVDLLITDTNIMLDIRIISYTRPSEVGSTPVFRRLDLHTPYIFIFFFQE
jgi:hypothetical protein